MTNPKRIQIRQHFRVAQLADEILLECPNCGTCVTALDRGQNLKDRKTRLLMTCLHCAKVQEFVLGTWDFWNALPLWLRTRCCGEVLWALNARHLFALQEYVAAGLRENKLEYSTNRHMYMSLPRWMTSKKNRRDILRGLKRLQAKLQP